MKREIERYAERDSHVVRAYDGRAVAHVESKRPALDTLVRVGEVLARVVRHVGTREVELDLLGATVEPDAPLEIVGGTACLPPIEGPEIRVDELRWVEPDTPGAIPWGIDRPSLTDVVHALVPVETGHEPIDVLAPLVRGGVNLVIHETRTAEAFHVLLEPLRQHDRASPPFVVSCESPGDHPADADLVVRTEDESRRTTAVSVALNLVDALKERHEHLLFVADLTGAEAAMTEYGAALTSTKDATVTTALRLPVGGRNVAAIVESLGLGEIDTQLFVDSAGQVDLKRSWSNVELEPDLQSRQSELRATLRRASDLRDKIALLGDCDLSEEDEGVLERADALRVRLVEP